VSKRFITSRAKKIVEAGGSLRDVQELAGHTSLATTQKYIQGDTAAKRNVMKLIGDKADDEATLRKTPQ
jgi:integrase/recombinase XerD